MIPLSLTIKGIYSYEKEYTIDFQDIASEGVFGIFGKVGSGKSAIIEALTYGLYGKSDRHSKGHATHTLNLNSERGLIIFTFKNFENKTFKTETQLIPIAKDKKNVRRAYNKYELINNEWTKSDKSIEEIIGLDYENFKRTIVIPQGQFKEFIELTPTNRNKMMQSLFNLDRFDLSDVTNRLFSETKAKEQYKEGVLSQLQPFMEIVIKDEEESIDEFSKHVQSLEQSVNEKEKIYSQLLEQEKAWKGWQDIKLQLKSIQEKEELMKVLEKDIKKQESFQLYLKAPYLQWKESKEEQEKNGNEMNNTQRLLKENKEHIDTLEKKHTSLAEKKKTWEQRKKEAEEYKFLAAIIGLQTTLSQKEQAISGLEAKTNAIIPKINDYNLKLNDLNERIVDLEHSLVPLDNLLKVNEAYQKLKLLNTQQRDLKEQITSYQERQQTIVDWFKTHEIDIIHWENTIEKHLENLAFEERQVSNNLDHLRVHEKLEEFSTILEDGKPCHLCGALEHPTPLQANPEATRQSILELSARLTSLQYKNKTLTILASHAEQQVKTHQEHQKAIDDLSKKLNEVVADIKKLHDDSNIWGQFHPDKEEEYQKSLNNSKKQDQELKNLRQEYRTSFQKREALQKEQQDIQEQLNPLNNEKLTLNGRIENGKEHITRLPLEWINTKNSSQLIEEKQQLENILAQEALDHEQTSKKLQEAKSVSGQLTFQLGELEKTKEQLGKKLVRIREILDQNMKTYSFQSFEELAYLSNILFPLEEKKHELSVFKSEKDRLQTLAGQYTDEVKLFNQDILDKTKNEMDALKQTLSDAKETLVIKQGKLKEVKDKQELYKKEHEELEQIQSRLNNLNTLRKLFIGKGFVEYASVYWLKRLVQNSNQHFKKLTHNQLSLQLNDELDFEIVDYLNGGQTRAISSLSGGQSFQVSLSMALALAEGVQANFNTDEQFFFMDEGFGTLDDEAIQNVYETLTKLITNHRKIGIISHVTALQEQIPRQLRIVKKDEGGSHVTFY